MKRWQMIRRIKKGIDRGESVLANSRKLGIDRKRTVRRYRDMSHEEVALMMRHSKKRAKR